MQPLFTIQNLHMQLVKINHTILTYLSITAQLCLNKCLIHGFKMAESSINSQDRIYESKRLFGAFTLAKVVIFQKYTQVICRLFGTS